MRKLLLSFLALLSTGCMTVTQGGATQKYILLQTAVIVRVQNNCAPFLSIETTEGVIASRIAYGDGYTVLLPQIPFTSNQVWLTVKGYTAQNEYLGSANNQFSTNSSQGTQRVPWEINYLSLPNGRGGCFK
jgi:hypothetical protein